ncbi:hypothetical protein M2326_000603 [Flavobacterium sp. 7A]|nr:hypothetical protein [Flavobacterium sp. 7A]
MEVAAPKAKAIFYGRGRATNGSSCNDLIKKDFKLRAKADSWNKLLTINIVDYD